MNPTPPVLSPGGATDSFAGGLTPSHFLSPLRGLENVGVGIKPARFLPRSHPGLTPWATFYRLSGAGTEGKGGGLRAVPPRLTPWATFCRRSAAEDVGPAVVSANS